MLEFEISRFGSVSTNYDAINQSSDDDSYEMREDWFIGWGYQATMTSRGSFDKIRVCEKWWYWNPTFELLDGNEDHFATFEQYGGAACCGRDFYQVMRFLADDETSYESGGEERGEIETWFTIEQDFGLKKDPDFIFRQPNHNRGDDKSSKKALRVATLSTDFSSWSPRHSVQISDDCTSTETGTILAAALTIVLLNERKQQATNGAVHPSGDTRVLSFVV